MTDEANGDLFSDDQGDREEDRSDADEAASRAYGAEPVQDDSAPDIVVRGAKKDEADAEKKSRRRS